jgi:hypothetical protein
LGAGPEDILIATTTGGGLFYPGFLLGLTMSADLNALDIIIPEPGTLGLLVLGLSLTACRSRRRA